MKTQGRGRGVLEIRAETKDDPLKASWRGRWFGRHTNSDGSVSWTRKTKNLGLVSEVSKCDALKELERLARNEKPIPTIEKMIPALDKGKKRYFGWELPSGTSTAQLCISGNPTLPDLFQLCVELNRAIKALQMARQVGPDMAPRSTGTELESDPTDELIIRE